MPSPKRKPAPQASLPKRLKHAFYLAQPVLQFMALLSLMLVLARCSPLASSTDKTISPRPDSNSGGGNGGVGNSEEFLKEDLIVKSLIEVPSTTLAVVSESGFQSESENSFQAERPVREGEVKSRMNSWGRIQTSDGAKKPRLPLLTISLTADQQQALWRDGSVRIALADYLQASFELGARKVLFRQFSEKHDRLKARSYLVIDENGAPLNSQADLHELVMNLKVSLGVLSDEKAYLELRRPEEDSKTALLLSAAHGVRKLAVVLE